MVSAFLLLTLDYFVGRLFGISNHVNSNATSICSNSPLYKRPIHFLRVSPLTLDLEPQKVLKENRNNHFRKIFVKINILV